MVELSIIFPAFNEESVIKQNIQAVQNKLYAMGLAYEIIIVDDGSTDGTFMKAKECQEKRTRVYHYNKNRGKGFAVQYGMSQAAGTYKMFMDVDLSTSLDAVRLFLECMRKGEHDVIIGNRKSKESRYIANQPWCRRFLGQGFIILSKCCAGNQIHDFSCGFKMFNQRASDIIFKRQRIFGWTFDTELIYIALFHHLRIAQLPVVWENHQMSHVHPWSAVFHGLLDLMRIKWNAVKGRYK